MFRQIQVNEAVNEFNRAHRQDAADWPPWLKAKLGVVEAQLVKRRSENGLIEVEDYVPLGKTYLVWPHTRRRVKALHESGAFHEPEMVQTVEGSWLPAELLEWPGK